MRDRLGQCLQDGARSRTRGDRLGRVEGRQLLFQIRRQSTRQSLLPLGRQFGVGLGIVGKPLFPRQTLGFPRLGQSGDIRANLLGHIKFLVLGKA